MEPIIDHEIIVDRKTGLVGVETHKSRYLTLNYSHLAVIAAASMLGTVLGSAFTHWIGL